MDNPRHYQEKVRIGANSRAKAGVILPLLFGLILLLGGAGDDYPLIGAAVQASALAILALLAWVGRDRPVGGIVMAGYCLAVAVVLLVVVQLIPLGSVAASSTSARQLAALILRGVGLPPSPAPISVDPELTLQAALELLPGLAMFLAALHGSERERSRLLAVGVLAACTSAAIGLFQKAAGVDFLYNTAHAANGPGLFVNRNHQATFLLVAIVSAPAVVRRLIPATQEHGRLLLGSAVTVFLAAGVVATTSRAGLILLLPTLLVASLIGLRRIGPGLFLPGCLTAGGLVYGALQLPAIKLVLARFADGDIRSTFWQDTWVAARAFWPLGSGIGSYPRAFPLYERDDVIAGFSVNAAHNDYAQLLLEGGLPAAVLMGVAALLFLGTAVALARNGRTGPSGRVGWGALAGLAIILLHSAVDYPLRMMSIMALFGLLAGVALTEAGEASGKTQTKGRRGVGPPRRLAWLAIPPVFVLGCIAVGDAAARSVSDSHAAWRLHAAPMSSAVRVADGLAALQAGNLPAAEQDARKALARSPLDDQALELMIRVLDARHAWEAEKHLLQLAGQLTKRNLPTRMMLTSDAAKQGNFAEAIRGTDLLLRQHAYEDQLFSYLRLAMPFPEARKALVTRLAAGPGWRPALLRELRGLSVGGHADHAILLHDLRATAAPPTRREFEPFLRVLIEAGNAPLARAVRADARGLRRDLAIQDPGFAHVTDNDSAGLFGWQVNAREASSQSWPPGEATSPGVTIANHGSGSVLEQTTLLTPARYDFVWRIEEASTGATRSLQWTMRCLGGEGKPLLGLPRITQSGRGAEIRQSLEIPASCPAQRLVLLSEGADDGSRVARLIRASIVRR